MEVQPAAARSVVHKCVLVRLADVAGTTLQALAGRQAGAVVVLVPAADAQAEAVSLPLEYYDMPVYLTTETPALRAIYDELQTSTQAGSSVLRQLLWRRSPEQEEKRARQRGGGRASRAGRKRIGCLPYFLTLSSSSSSSRFLFLLLLSSSSITISAYYFRTTSRAAASPVPNLATRSLSVRLAGAPAANEAGGQPATADDLPTVAVVAHWCVCYEKRERKRMSP